MNYLSIEFGLLFIVFLGIYWGVQHKPNWQNKLILVMSYAIICSYRWQYGVILLGYSCMIYLISLAIYRVKKHKKIFLIIGLSLAILNLAIFKYFDFFRYELQTFLNLADLSIILPTVTILAPIGISFYTFHSVSYLVSVYKKEIPIAKFWDIALFLAFFPSVIAGPINRAKRFLPQIVDHTRREILNPHRAFSLITLAIIKVYCIGGLISDNWVNPIFANPLEFSSLDLVFGLYAYAIQIYFNFSGYTDLVTGIALLLGFKLPVNFNAPYLATNLREFWDRWHISLSTWIRDYIYIPLGGSRKGFVRAQINVMIAMLLSGLWHGVGINFIIWAICHAIGMIALNICEHYFGKNLISKRSPFIARVLTMHYICFAWLFFHCDSLDDAIDYLTAFYNNFVVDSRYITQFLMLCGVYVCYPWLKNIPDQFIRIIKKMSYFYLPFIFILILSITIYMAPSGVPNFIYASF